MSELKIEQKRSLIKMVNKLFLITIISVIMSLGPVLIVKAQDKIDTYSMSALGSHDYNNFDISISDDKSLWFDVHSAYAPGIKCGFKIEENLQQDFIGTLLMAKDQYTDWKQTAIENNTTDIKKKMDFFFFTEGYFAHMNELKFDKDAKIIFAFTYFKGDYILILNIDNMTTSDNQPIAFNGATLVFNSEKEIDNFLNKISTQSNGKPVSVLKDSGF